ncbi:MAG: hypothetical protein COU51_04765 [Parcubacteria group bacterium CG10_big_fil_rev_8_21_14_0_10_36_14]|nr:MAG: hypothetical protein COU51_04765 [Parcubacteria group bacterium CG10_big_fil_rev_8_21_14_0_10_36_14]
MENTQPQKKQRVPEAYEETAFSIPETHKKNFSIAISKQLENESAPYEDVLFDNMFHVLSEGTDKHIDEKKFKELISPEMETSLKIKKILSAFDIQEPESHKMKEDLKMRLLYIIEDLLSETHRKEALELSQGKNIATLSDKEKEELLNNLENLEKDYEKQKEEMIDYLDLKEKAKEKDSYIGMRLQNSPETAEERKIKEESFLEDFATTLSIVSETPMSEDDFQKLIEEKTELRHKIQIILNKYLGDSDEAIQSILPAMRKQLLLIASGALDEAKNYELLVKNKQTGKIDIESWNKLNKKYAEIKKDLIEYLWIDPKHVSPGYEVEDTGLENFENPKLKLKK